MYARAVAAFLAAGRDSLLRNVDTFFSAAFDGIFTRVPEEFVCPITMVLFNDPVVAADGFTYERWAIVQHLKRQQTSPKTNLPLANEMLIPNANMRIHIQDLIRRLRAFLVEKQTEDRKANHTRTVLEEPVKKRQRRK